MRRSMPDRLKSRISDLRKAKKLTQGQLAEIIGVRTSMISYYENNQVYPEPDKVIKLCDAFGCQWGKLFEVLPP